jgi:hypothetical protein
MILFGKKLAGVTPQSKNLRNETTPVLFYGQFVEVIFAYSQVNVKLVVVVIKLGAIV